MKSAILPSLALASGLAAFPAGAGAASAPGSRGWHFGRTGLGLGLHYANDQVPAGIATGRSAPSGIRLSQEFYSGGGLRLGLVGDWAWGKAEPSCLFCVDYSASGRYYWDTRYASAAIRVSPDREGLLGGFGAEVGYARYLYEWGVGLEGWDSRFPNGNILAGEYGSHQAFLGSDYAWSLRKRRWGLAFSGGLRQVVASRNTFIPRSVLDFPADYPFARWPLTVHFSVKVER